MKKNYTPDSLERALAHHVKEGRLSDYLRDDKQGARARWFIVGNTGTNPYEVTMSDSECAALCFGLASAQYARGDC